MTISMYQASAATFIHKLNNLAAILEKAAAHAEARQYDGKVLVNSRLFPDMLPLSAQIQIATDGAKGGVARLAGQQPPKYDDNESTLAELVERIRKTVAYLQGFTAEQIDGSEERAITLQVGKHTFNFTGLPYLLHFVTPNFYFHITTAYNILRHNGVEIGKRDYLGEIQ
jgi:hypothetical protein